MVRRTISSLMVAAAAAAVSWSTWMQGTQEYPEVVSYSGVRLTTMMTMTLAEASHYLVQALVFVSEVA